MKSTTKFFFVFLAVGFVGIVGYYFYDDYAAKKFRYGATDAKNIKGKIHIGIDNWIGYFPLCSQRMHKMMRSVGYLLSCNEDGASYDDRMKKLRRKEYDFIVATVDSFLMNGSNYNFPGSIILVIDESKGGDAIVSNKKIYPNLDSLKNPEADYKVAFTPSSPSEHLLRSISSHFDIQRIKSGHGWRYETDGSEEALIALRKGKVDIAVLWEPDVSKALKNEKFKKLLGTEDTKGLIVDILVAGNHTIAKNSNMIEKLVQNYFLTLKYYREKPEVLIQDVEKETGLLGKEIEQMLKGVAFANLHDNATKWFGVQDVGVPSKEGVINAIVSTEETLKETNAIQDSVVPDGNPYILQTSSFIEKTFKYGIQSLTKHSDQATTEEFTALSDSGWQELRDVGTLKVRPITFKSGTSVIDFDGQQKLKDAVESLQHYPNFRVVIQGHTGLRGNRAANLKLSRARAEAVKSLLVTDLGVNPNRLRAIGFGSLKPLPRKPGESYRAYKYRLPRVELRLVSEVF